MRNLKKQKILLTGSCGMLGAVLSRYFHNEGFDIVGIDNLSEGYIENEYPNLSTYLADICDLERMDQIFSQERPDFVINLGAEAAEILSPHIRSFTYNSNIIGTANIINCCVNYNVKKIIHFSSVARYGDNIPPFYESDPINPKEPYAFSKVLNEWDLKEAYEHFGLNYNIIVGYNLFSKYQNYYSLYRNVAAIYVRKAVHNEPLTIYGDGNQVRSLSDAQFICDPIRKLLNNKFPGEIFNLGSEKPITINELAAIVIKEANKRGYYPGIEHFEARKETKLAYCNTVKAQNLLGFRDKTDVAKLISEMFDYIQVAPKREITKRNYEIDKNLYSFWK